MSDPEGLRDRLTRSGEDALGKLAQELLENPLVNSALSGAFGARERAVQAQEAALGALNLPSAADLERLTRRLRSVSQRLEGIEDGVDRLDQRLEQLNSRPALSGAAEERLSAIEGQLTKLFVEVSALGAELDSSPIPVPREQERMEMGATAESAAKPGAKTPAAKKPAAKKPAAKKPAAKKPAARKPAAKKEDDG